MEKTIYAEGVINAVEKFNGTIEKLVTLVEIGFFVVIAVIAVTAILKLRG